MPSTVYIPKRLDIREIRELLGEDAAERLLTLHMRKKVAQVITLEPDELAAVEQLLRAPQAKQEPRTMRALARITLKRLLEHPLFRASFQGYLGKQQRKKEGKHGPKRCKVSH